MVKKLKELLAEKSYHSNSVVLYNLIARIFRFKKQYRLGAMFVKVSPYKKISVEITNNIPPLAWLCEIQDGRYAFTCGSKVETSEGYIFEGAWDGKFEEMGFAQTEFSYGSGASFLGQVVTFVPTRHCGEPLIVLKDKQSSTTFVSNSLCFVLERSGIETESDLFSQIEIAIESIREHGTNFGIDLTNPVLFKSEEIEIFRMLFYNFSFSITGDIKLYPLDAKRYFENYEQYRRLVSGVTARVCENAMSKSRKYPTTPISTISRGYDSSAAAVIANELGFKQAITIDVDVFGINDSGVEIGEKLGMEVKSFSHIIDDAIPDLNMEIDDRMIELSSEFIATLGVGDDVTFLTFESVFPQTVFLSGVYGDFVWEKQTRPKSGLPKAGFYGKSITEFRLRVGYFHVPVPSIGARFCPPVSKLMHSKEMERFSIGGNYDRPIARRIIEEAGIPREDFGSEKNATAPNILNRRLHFKTSIAKTKKRYSRQ